MAVAVLGLSPALEPDHVANLALGDVGRFEAVSTDWVLKPLLAEVYERGLGAFDVMPPSAATA